MTFESFLTPEGIIAAGALLTTLIGLIKGVFPGLAEKVSGALMAFAFSLLLYIATAFAVGIATPNDGLAIFASWLACAVAAVGIRETVVHVQETTGATPNSMLALVIRTVGIR